MTRRRAILAGSALSLCVSCAPRLAERPRATVTEEARGGEPMRDAGRVARVALALGATRPALNATGHGGLVLYHHVANNGIIFKAVHRHIFAVAG